MESLRPQARKQPGGALEGDGALRMALCPSVNHWWHVTLYVNARGLTTGPVPYPPGIFEIQFDFQKHERAADDDSSGIIGSGSSGAGAKTSRARSQAFGAPAKEARGSPRIL